MRDLQAGREESLYVRKITSFYHFFCRPSAFTEPLKVREKHNVMVLLKRGEFLQAVPLSYFDFGEKAGTQRAGKERFRKY